MLVLKERLFFYISTVSFSAWIDAQCRLKLEIKPSLIFEVIIFYFQDVPTKITIGKTFTSNTAAPVLQKPPPSVTRGPISTPALATTTAPTSQGNVIVVDLSPETSNVNNTNALADILQVSGIQK